MPAPTIVKVGLDSKRQIQYRKSMDLATRIVTVQIIEYWKVVFSGKQNDPTACEAATDGTHTVPVVGQQFRNSAVLAWVTETLPQIDTTSNWQQYFVQVTYSSLQPASTSTGKWDVQVSFDGVPITESAYYDLDDNQITNSAGQNFSQQPSRTYYDTAVQITFKTNNFDETDAEAIRGMINDSAVTISIAALNYSRVFPATTLRLDNFRAAPSVQSGQLAYWEVTLNLTYRPQINTPPHTQRPDATPLTGQLSTLEYNLVADMGYQFFDDTQSPEVLTTFSAPLADGGGTQACNAPQLLDGQGGDGRPTGSPSPDDAHYIAFRMAQRGSFSVLFAGIA